MADASGSCGSPPATPLGAAVEFFVYETPKVLLLLTLVVFGVGIVRSFFTPERTRAHPGRQARVASGNVLAALLGVVTPFCSCSAVPLFIGFVTAGVPLGVTFSFLISAPMVNEVALALLFGLFGWKVAALYLGTGLAIAIVAGWVIGRLRLEGWVEPWVYRVEGARPRTGRRGAPDLGRPRARSAARRCATSSAGSGPTSWRASPSAPASTATCPQDFMASIMGADAWWSVPLAVLIGVPMYSNAAGIIPVVQALLGKGAALGTVLAFMMAVIALSLPEMIILRKVLSVRLIAVFVGVVGAGILARRLPVQPRACSAREGAREASWRSRSSVRDARTARGSTRRSRRPSPRRASRRRSRRSRRWRRSWPTAS